MTSLMLRPVVDVSVSYDGDAISLYNVWKVTSSRVTCPQGLLRLCNRLWRLLNEQVLGCCHRKLGPLDLTLNNAPLAQKEQNTAPVALPKLPALSTKAPVNLAPTVNPVPPRPSLFLNTSKSTDESHLSLRNVLAQPFDLGDDTSDISEDGEYDSDELLNSDSGHMKSRIVDYESSGGRDKNIFYIGQSPLPKHLIHRHVSSKSQIGLLEKKPRVVNPSTANGEGKRAEHVPHLTSLNTSKLGHLETLDLHSSVTRSLSSNSRNGNRRSNVSGLALAGLESCRTNTLNGSRTLNGTTRVCGHNHRVSVADTSDTPNPPCHDSLFNADLKGPASHLSSLSSTDISESEDEFRPPSVPQSRISKSATDDSEWMSISSESEHVNDSPRNQPLTFAKVIPGHTAKMTISAETDPAALSDETRRASPVLKPRSLLSGLFLNEMGGSPNKMPPKPVLKRSSTTGVITVDKARPRDHRTKSSILFSKRYASFSDISRNTPHFRSPVLFVEEEELGDVPEKPNKSDSDNLLVKQMSSVGLSNFMANASIGETRPVTAERSPTQDALEGNLSSSMSKYSSLYPSAGSSFKNILSKSSLNILSLFSLHKPKMRSYRSLDNYRLPPHAEPLPSLFEGYLSQQNSQDALEHDSKVPPKSIKVNPVKNFEPSVEISESLKDSLMIDHKLGKIPLPERVISDEDLFHGKDKLAFIEDADDYYSKGW